MNHEAMLRRLYVDQNIGCDRLW